MSDAQTLSDFGHAFARAKGGPPGDETLAVSIVEGVDVKPAEGAPG